MDLSLREAAQLFGVSESAVTRWVKDEGLSAFLINDRYRFHRVDLIDWARRRKLPLGPEAAESDGIASAAACLAQALEAGGIHHGVPGSDAGSALAAAAQRLPLSVSERALAAQVLMERERHGSTAVGDGIAVPHARSPLVFRVERPSASLCFLETPLDFGAADGKPVRALFVLLTPTVRLHLALLSQVAAALHDPGFRELVIRQAPAEQLLARLRGRP